MISLWHQGSFRGFSAVINGEVTTPTDYKTLRLVQLGYISEPIFIDAPIEAEKHTGYGERI